MAVRIEGAYDQALRAFRNPMLALLHRGDAALVVALFGAVFRGDRPQVSVADAHTEFDDALSQLRGAGYEGLPDRSARVLCRAWVAAGWLVRQVDDDGQEVYRLSAFAVDALEVAGRAAGGHARVSRSRILTLLEAIDRLDQDANPDVALRMQRLQREIDDRRAELARLDRGGGLDLVDDEQLREEAENVLLLARELPADFARVAEAIRRIQRETVTALRQEDRPTGEVLAAYLQAADALMDATAEGRAFAGAQKLLDDPQRLDEITGIVELVLKQPFAQGLTERQRQELGAITARVEQGFTAVLTAQRLASRVIAAQVRHHDPVRDRQVDEVLRDVTALLGNWIPQSRRGQEVEALTRLPRAQIHKLRMTTSDLGPVLGPQALPVRVDEGDGDVAADHTQAAYAWGGPHYSQVREALEKAVAQAAVDQGSAGPVSLAQVFAQLDPDSQRPVDLVGLLELAAQLGMDDEGEIVEIVTVRPDGSQQRFALEAANISGQEAAQGGGDLGMALDQDVALAGGL